MKPINEYEIDEWSLNDCVDWLAVYGVENIDVVAIIAKRLRELHENHRWIPVSEKLPTRVDADRHGYVIIREVENESPKRVYHALVKWKDIGKPNYFFTVTDWKRIDP